jgi:CubicO group peptidase (beta-lactamase class C family)
MSPIARDPRISAAYLVVVAILLTLSGCSLLDGPGDPSLGWNGRVLYEDGLGWGSLRNLTRGQFDAAHQDYVARGWIIVDVDVSDDGDGPRYALIAHENPDGRAHQLHLDLTSSEYNQFWTNYRDLGYRPLDVEGYMLDGALRFAGIWIRNVEGLAWSSVRNLTSSEYADYFEQRRSAGYRPIDIEAYDTPSGLRFAAIWYENVDGVAWTQLRNIDRDRYQQEATDHGADGYLMFDFESYATSDGQRYAAIWERPDSRPAYQIRTDRSALQYANLWRTYRDEGYRLQDFEHYGDDWHGGIWIENAARFRYPLKGAIDTLAQDYLAANGPTAVSVAIIQGGQSVYRRGFGEADPVLGKVAHAQSVYGLASVSKVIGGTLAALLEANGSLRDGTTFSLDLGLLTSEYLSGLPDHHTHTLEQLAAHLSCVAYYDTTPPIPDQTDHYDTALDAAESIWDVDLIDGCTVGSTRMYSTAAFTLLGAALEDATGRTVTQLLDAELFEPFGLSSMRVQFESDTLPADYERAVAHTAGGNPTSYPDNSWKVLGGGLESDAVDLARFGWLVLDGRIVDAAVRDQRLWSPVDTSCSGPGGGTCFNGLGWQLRTIGGRRVADHRGSATGVRAYLRVFRDDDLVVAVLTNAWDGDPGPLISDIADVILGP